jgi:SAM-dependent methyltransferase
MIPDWQLPQGVDRGLWDYLHASEMIAGYDEQMRASPLALADVAFCEQAFPTPGKLVDLGCGTGRLCVHFVARGYECVGVDLSEEMLGKARENGPRVVWVKANLVDLSELPEQSFDYAACLFSTLGMVRGAENRARVVANALRLLKPGGKFVLHAHNRFFRGLGGKRVWGQRWKTLVGSSKAGDITMSQTYGGAPLTLHHFTKREVVRLLEVAGFVVREVLAIDDEGNSATGSRVYGWLILGERKM